MRLICALGSSFAAGPGIEPADDALAGRSARNHPHQLAERIGASLVDLTVSGATTANLLEVPQTIDDGTVFAPQVDGISGDADLVTITAGGNDLGFIGWMLSVGLARLMPAMGFAAPSTESGEDDVERAASDLARVVDTTRSRAPSARITRERPPPPG